MTQNATRSRLQGFVLSSVWRTEHICVGCKQPLSFHQRVSNLGTCPLCGFRGDGVCTIAATTARSYRLIRTGPWWRFWEKPKRVYERERPVPDAVPPAPVSRPPETRQLLRVFSP